MWLRLLPHLDTRDKATKRQVRYYRCLGSDGYRWPEGRKCQSRPLRQDYLEDLIWSHIYLHYAFDLWAQDWRQRPARGDVVLVRYADDIVTGFQHKSDAEQFLVEFRQRLAKFGLELHPDKTRLIEFGRFAVETRRRRGEGEAGDLRFPWLHA